MNNTNMNNKEVAKLAIWKLRSGRMTYEDARIVCEPYINELNQKGTEIAKRFGKKFYPIAFAVFRNKFLI
jgi:hypothetical protein